MHETRLHLTADRTKLHLDTRRPAMAAGAFAVGDQAAGVHMDGRVDLIQLHGIDETHAAIAHMQHGQPGILVRGARTRRVAKEKLVHIGLAVARVIARDHGRGGRAEAPDLTHAKTITEFGHSALGRRGDAVREIGGRGRAADRMAWNADHARILELELNAPQGAGVLGHRVVDGVEHADIGRRAGAGFRDIQPAIHLVGIVEQIDFYPPCLRGRRRPSRSP